MGRVNRFVDQLPDSRFSHAKFHMFSAQVIMSIRSVNVSLNSRVKELGSDQLIYALKDMSTYEITVMLGVNACV